MKSIAGNSAAHTFITEHNSRVQDRQQQIQHMEDQITELAAHIHAATYRLLELLRDYDECNGWGSKGLASCAHWLNWKCGISLGAGREKMRVAHALKDLPKISREFRHGRVSYSKVRAMEEGFREQQDVPAGTLLPCSPTTPVLVFTSRPKRLRAGGWAKRWTMIWLFWECSSWNSGSLLDFLAIQLLHIRQPFDVKLATAKSG